MPFVRHASIALSLTLLLQLSLEGAGVPCASRSSGGHAGRGVATAPAMEMAVNGTVRASHGAKVGSPRGECEEIDSPDPCVESGMSGACAAMSSCIRSPSLPSTPAIAAMCAAPRVGAQEPSILRTAPAVAPELPPPRA